MSVLASYLKRFREYLHRGEQRVLRGLAETAKRRDRHDGGDFFHLANVRLRRLAPRHFREEQLDMQIAFATGCALTAGFFGEEVLGHAEKVENTGAVVDDEYRS